jgi:hypothetical protein
MSSDFYRRQAQTHLQEIARLQRDKGREAERVASYQKQSNDAAASASRTSSISSAQSYLRNAQRYSEQSAAAQKNIANIEDKIAREHSRIVHFSGHGSDQDEIVFQDANGQTKAVTKEAIVQTMAFASSDIQLVFFNTCYSRNQAEAVVKHVQAAIGMKTSIGDNAARVFAAQFYSAIGFGLSVKRAFDQAKAALMLEGIPEQDTPELFVADGVDVEQLIIVKPPHE